MSKPKAVRKRNEGDSYFSSEKENLELISSGCVLLDCVLGGGWPLGRCSNVVGDKSTGKTLLAMEGLANFLHQFPKGKAAYREVESAFDLDYATKGLGMPMDRVDIRDDVDTVEQFYEDLMAFVGRLRGSPGFYVLDSLDALSDDSEMKRDFADRDFPRKPAQMSQLFRRAVRELRKSRVHLQIVSQVRDNIGVTFGKRHTRSGGKALDFYASQVLWLAHLKRLDRTIDKVKRDTGVLIRAKCEKNKIGLPFRECDFEIKFGYGVDDIPASLNWLESIGRLKDVGLTKAEADQMKRQLDSLSAADVSGIRTELGEQVKAVWRRTEQTFLPKRAKYAE